MRVARRRVIRLQDAHDPIQRAGDRIEIASKQHGLVAALVDKHAESRVNLSIEGSLLGRTHRRANAVHANKVQWLAVSCFEMNMNQPATAVVFDGNHLRSNVPTHED
eukprot:2257708-Prymnesium_polylepis.1